MNGSEKGTGRGSSLGVDSGSGSGTGSGMPGVVALAATLEAACTGNYGGKGKDRDSRQ